MLGLLLGGAAILLGGLWIACKVLEHRNAERQAKYEELCEHYCREARRRTEDLDRIGRCDGIAERVASLQAAQKAADRAEKLAYDHWKEVRRSIWELGGQQKAAFSRKNELKD